MTPQKRHRLEIIIVIILITGRLLIAIGFSAIGTLEGPDEPGHFAYVRTIATSSPLVDPYLITDPLGQYHQAPLYYWIGASIAQVVGVGTDQQLRSFLRFNDLGDTRLPIVGKDNQNYWLHDISDRFPYTDNPIARAAHAVRLLSVLLGGLTVLAAYAAFREIWLSADNEARALRLMATGLIAFWPQLIFLSSVINNDNLLFLLSTLVIYRLLRQLRTGWTARGSIILGVLIGLVALTKINGLLLAFPVGAAALIYIDPIGGHRSGWRNRLKMPILAAIATAIIGGWWYARNAIVYSDPFNFRAMYVSWGGVTIPGTANGVALGYAIRSLPGVYETWWARFGYTGLIEVSSAISGFFNILSILGLIGLAILVIRAQVTHRPLFPTPIRRSQAIIFAIWLLALFAGLIYYAGREVQGNQARYLFPALAVIGVALVIGWRVWLRRGWLPLASIVLTSVLCGISVISLTGYYWPAFRPSPITTEIDHPLAIRFDTPTVAELVGAEVPLRALPGETIRITLNWRALNRIDHDLVVYLHSVGSQAIFRNSYPGGGTLLSTDWQPRDSWQETYAITIPADTPPHTTITVVAGLADRITNIPLPAFNGDHGSTLITPIIGQIAINAPPMLLPTPDYRLGSTVGVVNARVAVQADGIHLCVDWLSFTAQTADQHVFVHLLDRENHLIGQFDGVPLSGQYAVSGWGVNELIHDCLSVSGTANTPIPADAQIAFGLYDPISGGRLSASSAAGQRLPNDQIVLPIKQ